MQCEDATGFLMLRRCDHPAEFHCSYCGKALCSEHAVPLAEPPSVSQVAPAAEATTEPPQEPPVAPEAPTGDATLAAAAPQAPVPGQAVACRKCLAQQQQRVTGYYDDPYYHSYAYYGGYRPYYYDYDDRDREVFDRAGTGRTGVSGDLVGS
jgi:hypothetical protein